MMHGALCMVHGVVANIFFNKSTCVCLKAIFKIAHMACHGMPWHTVGRNIGRKSREGGLCERGIERERDACVRACVCTCMCVCVIVGKRTGGSCL